MVKCEDCKKEMRDSKVESCTHQGIQIDNKIYARNTTYYDVNERCHDCGILNKPGNIHHISCDIERCPKCNGQLILCDCKKGKTWLRKPVSFLATKRIPKRVNIEFSGKATGKVSFLATKREPKIVKVAFFEEVDAGPRLKDKIYQRKQFGEVKE